MENGKIIKQVKVKDFDLDHIFDCGQCFRWRKQDDGSYTGIAEGRIVNMSLSADNLLTIKNICGRSSGDDFDAIWKDYLDLDTDYGEIKKTLSSGDPVMKKAISGGEGIRILKQDLWEAIVDFIISQNNNIPRIKGCIENLSRLCGEPLAGDYTEEICGLAPFDIPSPEKLASMTVEELAPVRLGYRAKYLIETGRQVCEKGLPNDYEGLVQLCGVGPKVANCIALFGMGMTESFPIDVWVKRVMNVMYGFDEEDKKGMAEFAKKRYGKLSGYAQQYLFYYIREQKN